jgi:hypothetical protein
MAVLNGFVAPTFLVWDPKELDYHVYIMIKIEGYIIDFLFIFDIFLQFLTSYLEITTGKEVTDPYKIAVHYSYSKGFFFDAISILGSEIFTDLTRKLKVFSFFKMFRIRRLSHYVSALTLPVHVKSTIKLFKTLTYLMLYLHSVSCLWALTTKINYF